MSKSTIRSFYDTRNVRFRRVRQKEHDEILESNGNSVGVFELEGTIFFGSADTVSKQVLEKFDSDLKYVVLDLMRVNEMDSTAARILQQLQKRLVSQEKLLFLSHVQPQSYLWNFMNDLGVIKTIGEENIFPDTDHAIEHCEELILKKHLKENTFVHEEYPLDKLEIFQGLKSEEINLVSQNMVVENFDKGDYVFQQGDTNDKFYYILQGLASVYLPIPDSSYIKRMVTFGAGTTFGEMNLFALGPRSASILAAESLTCISMTIAEFERIKKNHPNLTYMMVFNLSKEFVRRTRRSDSIIKDLSQ